MKLMRHGDDPIPVKHLCPGISDEDVEHVSDGYHTFKSLYEQRKVLFATIVSLIPERAWKSKRHSDGEPCFGGGWFIVGIETPEGQYTYHYELDAWDMFPCEELPEGKEWDGHTDADVHRMLSLAEVR